MSRISVPPLYAASVPVFLHYIERMEHIAGIAGDALYEARIADAFPASQQFATAAMFAVRTACPLAGREAERLDGPLPDRLADARGILIALDPEAFAGAGGRRIRHRAGFAELDQSGAEFLTLYGLPNFFFHLTMGYAALRAAGLPLGKADFDGLHDYPPGFAF